MTGIGVVVAAAGAACVALLTAGVALLHDEPLRQRFDTRRASAGRDATSTSPVMRFFDWSGGLLAEPMRRVLGQDRLERVAHRLDAAGRPNDLDATAYAGRKAVFTLLFAAASAPFLVSGQPVVFVLACLAGWFLIDLSVASEARVRQRAIERDLPDFLDVLAVTISAGMGFRPALARVAAAFPGALGDEVRTALRQMSLGAGWRRALVDLRGRNDSARLDEFVTALLLAEELGVELTGTIRQLARDIRRSYEQEARRDAARAGPRVSVIVSFTLVPAALVLVVAGLYATSGGQFAEVFGG